MKDAPRNPPPVGADGGEHEGTVRSVRGGVVDVQFPDKLPPIHTLIEAGEAVLEVITHVSDDTVRCIGLTDTLGLAHGDTARDTGGPLRVPVGTELLGRAFNVFGEPIDRGDPLNGAERRSIHQPPAPLDRQSVGTEVFETGLKVLDLLSPLERGGKTGLFGVDIHRLAAVGERAAGRLEEEGTHPGAVREAPGSVSGVGRVVRELLFQLEKWESEAAVDHVFLFYNRSLGGAACEPQAVHLLPLDRDWLDRLRRRPWEGRCLPMVSEPPGETVSALVREYLFATLFRALADALAAENASRLAAMQGAEGKVAERLDDLRREYHRHRQQAITEELLDIAAGFEALREL
jgi:hypothetical protein